MIKKSNPRLPLGRTSVIHIHSPGTVPENSWKCQFFPIFWDLSNIYKVILSIHKYKTLRLLLSRMDCNSKNLGSIFPQIETKCISGFVPRLPIFMKRFLKHAGEKGAGGACCRLLRSPLNYSPTVECIQEL